MKRFIISSIIVLTFAIFVSAQTEQPQSQTKPIPKEFKSDGCTSFPDGVYADCCVAHDLDYFYGGSWRERWRSDKRLYQCVKSKGGFKHSVLALMMWSAVRMLGAPFLPTKSRWGFGKDLIKAEKKSANDSSKSKELKN